MRLGARLNQYRSGSLELGQFELSARLTLELYQAGAVLALELILQFTSERECDVALIAPQLHLRYEARPHGYLKMSLE